MTCKTRLVIYGALFLVISLPFASIHVMANPDDAPITPIQHLVAALANYFGPWGVVIVRIVDFPNAGLRSFSWMLAVSLTVIGALIIKLATLVKNKYLEYLLITFWALFTMIWFITGLSQIAHGLL